MPKVSKADVKKLHSAVKLAFSYVDEGDTPNGAFVKVSRERGLAPGMLKSACAAYNTGQQLHTWEGTDELGEKLASFPLADFDKIAAEIWGKDIPSAEKEASPTLHLTLPTKGRVAQGTELLKAAAFDELYGQRTEKVASEYDNRMTADELLAMQKLAQEDYEEARRQATACKDYFGKVAYDIQKYLKQDVYRRPTKQRLKNAASAWLQAEDQEALEVFDMAGEERDPGLYKEADAKPFLAMIETFCKTAKVHAQLAELVAREELAVGLCIEKVAECGRKGSVHSVSVPEEVTLLGTPKKPKKEKAEKEAYAGAALGAASTGLGAGKKALGSAASAVGSIMPSAATGRDRLAGSLGRAQDAFSGKADLSTIATGEQALDNMRNSARKYLDDPVHVRNLSSVKVQSALARAMTDPRSALSGFDPEDVMLAYNELAESAPHIAQNPMTLGPALSRYMMEQMDTQEATSLINANNAMGQYARDKQKSVFDMDNKQQEMELKRKQLLQQIQSENAAAKRQQRVDSQRFALDSKKLKHQQTTDAARQGMDKDKFQHQKGTDASRQELDTNKFQHQKGTDAARQGLDKDRFKYQQGADASRQDIDAARAEEQQGSNDARQALEQAKFDYQKQQDAAKAESKSRPEEKAPDRTIQLPGGGVATIDPETGLVTSPRRRQEEPA